MCRTPFDDFSNDDRAYYWLIVGRDLLENEHPDKWGIIRASFPPTASMKEIALFMCSDHPELTDSVGKPMTPYSWIKKYDPAPIIRLIKRQYKAQGADKAA